MGWQPKGPKSSLLGGGRRVGFSVASLIFSLCVIYEGKSLHRAVTAIAHSEISSTCVDFLYALNATRASDLPNKPYPDGEEGGKRFYLKKLGV